MKFLKNFSATKDELTASSSTQEQIIKHFEKRQIVYSILGLLILMGVSIIANNLHLQSVAEQSTRYVTRLIQIGDMRDATFVLEESLKGNFESITFNSDNPSRSFMLPANKMFIKPSNSLWSSFYRENVTIPFVDPLSGYKFESITYEYNRLGLVPYAVLLWIFILLISIPQTRIVKRRLIEQFEKDLILEKSKVNELISEEVRHNLRTPLASLMRLPARLPESLTQDRELLKTSIEQIRKITAALDRKKINQVKDGVSSDTIYDTLCKSVNQISSTTPPNIDFDAHIDDPLCSAKVDHIPVEFQIILGNIINNSIDALQSTGGRITFRAKDMAPDLIIEIEDNGPGIQAEILDHIFNQGFTSGKTSGTGLGLYHAKTWIEKWGGTIKAQSDPNNKTVISIRLPISDRASWYVPRLKFKTNEHIFVLDDQITARQLWKIKLSECGVSANVHLLCNSSEAKSVFEKQDIDFEAATFLFDFDLKEEITGMDLLNQLPKNAHRYLATGHFDKPEIRNACERSGIFLIPKSEIAELPVVVI